MSADWLAGLWDRFGKDNTHKVNKYFRAMISGKQVLFRLTSTSRMHRHRWSLGFKIWNASQLYGTSATSEKAAFSERLSFMVRCCGKLWGSLKSRRLQILQELTSIYRHYSTKEYLRLFKLVANYRTVLRHVSCLIIGAFVCSFTSTIGLCYSITQCYVVHSYVCKLCEGKTCHF